MFLFTCLLTFLTAVLAPGVILANRSRPVQGSGLKPVIREIQTTKKALAITFDDGPDPRVTPAVLEVLKKHRAKATFFVVGTQTKKHPHLVKQAFQEGHEIGNHGYAHNYKLYGQPGDIEHDIKQNEQLIYLLTGQRPTVFRPPGGYITPELIDFANTHGFQVILWSWIQDTKDWLNPPAARQAAHIVKYAKPGQILIFHDCSRNGNNSETPKAIDLCMEELTKQGYRFVTVSELIRIGNEE